MEKLLEALDKKKIWMNKLVAISKRYCDELNKNSSQAIESLDSFDNNRESLVRMIAATESTILAEIPNAALATVSPETKQIISDHIAHFDKKFAEMRCVDSEILEILDTLRDEQKRKISDLRKGKNALENYRGQRALRSNIDVQL